MHRGGTNVSVFLRRQRCASFNRRVVGILRPVRPQTTRIGQTRNTSGSSGNSKSSANETSKFKSTVDESHLNWKERSEAPRWMQRIAPTKGGKISDLKSYEIAALLSGMGVFYYAWFVAEPPKPKPEVSSG